MGEEEKRKLIENNLTAKIDDGAAAEAISSIQRNGATADSGVKQIQAKNNSSGFSYDFASDPMYQQYRQQYMEQADRAMRDTMGQAASLTGGYGSSYAQRVGQQAYDSYMDRLNDVIPDLYNLAYQRYQDDYARKQNAYQTLSALISSTGYKPSTEELEAAGMSAAEAKALADRYAYDKSIQERQLQIQYMNAMPKISYGGGGVGSVSPAVNATNNYMSKDKTVSVAGKPTTINGYGEVRTGTNMTRGEIVREAEAAYKKGQISLSEYNTIKRSVH